MIQTAVVKRIVSSTVAEVSLMRQLECGLSCKSCEGCPQKPKDEILALAENPIGAQPGMVVEVESNSGSAIGIAALVYLVPCVFLIFGYLLGAWLGLGEGLCVLMAFGGLVVGFVPALLLNRAILRSGRPEFTILRVRG
ncbi:MAG: hypothetical protein E7440_04230 [Ruminococcaceae bacterium]|nr:hypothetical protein [Oscillospiraceae bacterium]